MYHCIGCGAKIDWDGSGTFCYTCPCGATILVNDERVDSLAIPSSLAHSIRRKKRRPLPHLDDIVGNSDYMSPEKESVIADLRLRGFIWMGEWTDCLIDDTWIQRKKKIEYSRAMRVVDARFSLGELTIEEARQERLAVLERFEVVDRGDSLDED